MNTKELLNRPIPPECIEKKQGLDYVSHGYTKRRMNECFGPDGWSYNVIEVRLDRKNMGAFVHVRVKANIDGVWVERDGCAFGFAPKPGTATDEQWRANSQTFDFAVAEGVTDAFKRAAMSYGEYLGLQLYPDVKGGKGSAPKGGAAKATNRRVVRRKKA